MNPTTGEVPIAILAADGRLEAAKRLTEEHQRVIAVPRPHSDEVLTNVMNQLAALADRDAVPANERVGSSNASQGLARQARVRLSPVLRHPPHGSPHARPASLATNRKTCPSHEPNSEHNRPAR